MVSVDLLDFSAKYDRIAKQAFGKYVGAPAGMLPVPPALDRTDKATNNGSRQQPAVDGQSHRPDSKV